MLTTVLCARNTVPTVYQLLSKDEKTLEEYEALVIHDGQLTFGTIEMGDTKFIGQTRHFRVK